MEIRLARAEDVPAIVALLADDPLGAQRERPGDPAYAEAFERLSADPNQVLLVGEAGGEVVATLQLTFIPGLSRIGATRSTVEAVRVRSDQRGTGNGHKLMEAAIERARERGASIMQLTSDVTRVDAHRFYERLGFVHSHVGMKLTL